MCSNKSKWKLVHSLLSLIRTTMQHACLGDSSKGKLILHVHISTVRVGEWGRRKWGNEYYIWSHQAEGRFALVQILPKVALQRWRHSIWTLYYASERMGMYMCTYVCACVSLPIHNYVVYLQASYVVPPHMDVYTLVTKSHLHIISHTPIGTPSAHRIRTCRQWITPARYYNMLLCCYKTRFCVITLYTRWKLYS